MSRSTVLLAIVLLALAVYGPAYASGSLYGLTGVIETPDDRVAPEQSITLNGAYVSKFQDSDANLTIYGGNVGLGSKLEFGYATIKSDAAGAGSPSLMSAKLSVGEESADGPGIAVGIVDMGRHLGDLNPAIRKTSAFIVVGRNLTATADRFSRSASKPVKGTIGAGTGLYEGVFGSLDFYLTSQVEIKLEYLTKGLRQKSTVNSAVQFNVLENLAVQAGTLAWEDFYASVSYTMPIK